MVMPHIRCGGRQVYVNARQYERIMRRREQRAKAERENKLLRSRQVHEFAVDPGTLKLNVPCRAWHGHCARAVSATFWLD